MEVCEEPVSREISHGAVKLEVCTEIRIVYMKVCTDKIMKILWVCDSEAFEYLCDSNNDLLLVPDESLLFELIFWRRIGIKLLMVPVRFT